MTGRNGWPLAPSARADALLDQLHELAAAEERRRRLLLLAATAAVGLHALLLVLVPRPASETIAIPIDLDRFVLAPTPRLAPPPAPVDPPVRRTERRVPVPDPTPEEPEPLARPVLETPLEIGVLIDDSAVAIPAPPTSSAPETWEVGGDVAAPVRRFAPEPVYPRAALLARREATVIVEAVIDARGAVTSLRPLTAHGFGFEEAAVSAVRDWRFRPATRRGEPVPVLYRLSVTFRLVN